MKGQINHKFLRAYSPIKANLRGYRRCWPRNRDTAILIKSLLGSVNGELYSDILDRDLNRIIRLLGVPHNYTIKKVIVTSIKEKKKQSEAMIFYPNDEIIRQWLLAEKKEREKKEFFGAIETSDELKAGF
jgi:hypothetical protein